jgi:hypothetical protein
VETPPHLFRVLNAAAWQQADGYHSGSGRRGAHMCHKRADLPPCHPVAPQPPSVPHSPLSRAATGDRRAVRHRKWVHQCGRLRRVFVETRDTWSACSVAVRRGRCVKSIGPVRITTALTASPWGNSPFCSRHNVFSERSLRAESGVRSEAARAAQFLVRTVSTRRHLQQTSLLRK